MAFCGYCGAEMPDDMSFCTECGKPLTRGRKPIDGTGNDINQNSIYQDEMEEPVDVESFSQDNTENFINDSSFDNWTMSEGLGDLIEPENLYDSLKSINDRKNRAERKKYIIPLAMTVLFLVIAIVFVIIKFKPYEKWFNKQAESVAEESMVETVQATEEEPVVKPSQTPVQSVSSESEKEPVIKDMQACFRPIIQYYDYVYIDYYYEVYNPNTSIMFESFQLTENLRDSSNMILGTDTSYVNLILPGETVYVFGTIQLTKSEAEKIASDDCQYEWDVETESRFYSPIRQSEIEVLNVSARGMGYNVKVTGEVKNNSSYDTSALTRVYALFWKGEELVAIDSTYIDSVYSNDSRVFEVRSLHEIPDYDTVEIYVDVY